MVGWSRRLMKDLCCLRRSAIARPGAEEVRNLHKKVRGFTRSSSFGEDAHSVTFEEGGGASAPRQPRLRR